MPIGDPGQGSFRRAIMTLRNLHVAAALSPLFTMRAELLGNDELTNRGGFDDPTRDHLISHLVNCDRWRRRVTHNPEDIALGDEIEKALNTENEITIGKKPFGGDNVQNQSGGRFDLPYALDGSDDDIPMLDAMNLKSPQAITLANAVDRAITGWTRLNSRSRTRFITANDSLRVYGWYQEILGFLKEFGGDDNQIDIAQVLPSEEPLGAGDSPNRKTESSGRTSAAS